MIEVSAITATTSLILVDVPHEYNGILPFSSSINEWCYSKKSFLGTFRTTDESTNGDEAGANDSKQDGKEDDETEVIDCRGAFIPFGDGGEGVEEVHPQFWQGVGAIETLSLKYKIMSQKK